MLNDSPLHTVTASPAEPLQQAHLKIMQQLKETKKKKKEKKDNLWHNCNSAPTGPMADDKTVEGKRAGRRWNRQKERTYAK